jgi:ABC-type nitrate/sulfonate/bicarbonate transport system permease component
MKNISTKIQTTLGFVILLVSWTLVVLILPISRVYIATPFETLKELGRLLLSGELLRAALETTWKALVGLVLGSACGLGMGLSLATLIGFRRVCLPVVDFFRTLPAVALVPFMALLLGPGSSGQLLLIAWAVFFIVVVPTYQGVRDVNLWRLRAGRMLGLKSFDLAFRVAIPDALPQILSGGRLAVSIALLVTLVAEMGIGEPSGLGGLISLAGQRYQPQRLIAGILAIGGLGLLFNVLFDRLIERRLNWKLPKARRGEPATFWDRTPPLAEVVQEVGVNQTVPDISEDSQTTVALAVVEKAFDHAKHVEGRATYVFTVAIALFSLLLPLREAIEHAGNEMIGVPTISWTFYGIGVVLSAASLLLTIYAMVEPVVLLPQSGFLGHTALLRSASEVLREFSRLADRDWRGRLVVEACLYARKLAQMAAAKKNALYAAMLWLVCSTCALVIAFLSAGAYLPNIVLVAAFGVVVGLEAGIVLYTGGKWAITSMQRVCLFVLVIMLLMGSGWAVCAFGLLSWWQEKGILAAAELGGWVFAWSCFEAYYLVKFVLWPDS